MTIRGLDVRIRRLVVDAENRGLAAGLAGDIGRALEAELAAPRAPHPSSPDGADLAATIASRIAQSLTGRTGGAT
ncbi:hypothetical protein [Reyranella sp.]|uniref:hypothetical protein n=1 Tax=Reyranella sp. TaxID=1929291 RepID=UPI003BAB05ED